MRKKDIHIKHQAKQSNKTQDTIRLTYRPHVRIMSLRNTKLIVDAVPR